ncbi:hypothetical protein C2E23DRAFT_882887 [Lenzites betulinus]|nr:hypothetical protein C2E23DRAFT_882887 [Lenzites betulinus]
MHRHFAHTHPWEITLPVPNADLEKIPCNHQLRDIEFEQKYKEHRRAVNEVARQWPFPIKWSNALAFPPREILGPAPNERGQPPCRAGYVLSEMLGYLPPKMDGMSDDYLSLSAFALHSMKSSDPVQRRNGKDLWRALLQRATGDNTT